MGTAWRDDGTAGLIEEAAYDPLAKLDMSVHPHVALSP
jgi:hypothetical protein